MPSTRTCEFTAASRRSAPIDHAHAPDSRAHQQIRRRGPDRSAPGHNRARREQALLPLFADSGEQNLARIFLSKSLVHVASSRENSFVFL
jgi:hypothetical protein